MSKKIDFSGDIPGEEYQPYIPADSCIPELTLRSALIGIALAVVFGSANAYLGATVGMTVSASIPAAVISMGVLRLWLKKGTVLENNIAQTIGSAGESLAAGVIFTVPAIILLNLEYPESISFPSWFTIFILSLLGGLLGILFLIPLRRYLIVKEHGKLPYPEGTACAEVLTVGERGGEGAKLVFKGVLLGALYKLLMDDRSLGLWNRFPEWHFFHKIKEGAVEKVVGIKNAVITFDVLPMLVGVGYIIGPRISAFMLAGGVLGWWVLIPLISYIGGGLETAVYPASTLISDMAPIQIWSNYIRYIGAGAVAFGGLASLVKSFPTILQSFKLGFKEITSTLAGKVAVSESGEEIEELPRTRRDIPMVQVILGVLALFIIIGLVPQVKGGFLAALLIIIFGFFFVTVSSRIVGLVGSSSNPASGMTIATLLATTILVVAAGLEGPAAMLAAITIGAVVCIAVCIAGDTSQDLKTGFLLGATPWKQQVSEILGVVVSALAVGGTVILLNNTYGFDPAIPTALKAPQANLMKIIIEGVVNQDLPWILVFVGAICSMVVELFGLPSLAFAVGLYLPLELSTSVMVGGLVSLVLKLFHKKEFKFRNERGILYASGLIAGEAVLGVLIAVRIALNDLALAKGWWPGLTGSDWSALLLDKLDLKALPKNDLFAMFIFILLTITLGYVVFRKDVRPEDEPEPS